LPFRNDDLELNAVLFRLGNVGVPKTEMRPTMTAFSAGVTTGGDWTMWVSLTLLCVLGLAAAWSSRWFKADHSDA